MGHSLQITALCVILKHWLKETGFAVAAVRVKASVVHNI